MIRSIFLGIALFVLVMGIETQFIESFTPRGEEDGRVMNSRTVLEPWKPWALLGGGLVLTLWCFTLPKKIQSA